MSCPCINCICVAVCRFKPFRKLIDDCNLVVVYMNSHVWGNKAHLPYHRDRVRDAIDPVLWDVDSDGVFISKKGADCELPMR